MKRNYKTAQGQIIDIDALRLANEDAIAVGNMHVNARGDQLGPGGAVAKTRNQTMNEYYQIEADPIETMMHHQNQGVSVEEVPVPKKAGSKKINSKSKKITATEVAVPEQEPSQITDVTENDNGTTAASDVAAESTRPLRGNLADSIAKEAQVNQTLLKPLNKRNGIQRI